MASYGNVFLETFSSHWYFKERGYLMEVLMGRAGTGWAGRAWSWIWIVLWFRWERVRLSQVCFELSTMSNMMGLETST